MTTTQTAAPDVPIICTERQVQDRVARIRRFAEVHKDFPYAAKLEKVLWEQVLETIAGGHAQAGYLAAAALETKKIEFPRV
jgi:hypothetical protein